MQMSGSRTAIRRAAERTFQVLQQVTGRAGRMGTLGKALVQTWQPEHPVIRALLSGDAERFYSEETEQRRRAGLPPFGRLAALIVSAKDRASAENHARALVRAAHALPPNPKWKLAALGGLPQDDEITLLGRPRRRSLSFEANIVSACWCGRQSQPTCKVFCAPCWRRHRPRAAACALPVDVDPQNFM